MTEKTKKSKSKKVYVINPTSMGKDVWTSVPTTYKRKEGGKFTLDSNISQKDLCYLYEVKAVRKDIVKEIAE